MFNINYRPTKVVADFEYYTFVHLLADDVFANIKQESENFPFKLTDGDRTNTNGERIFLGKGHTILDRVAKWFASDFGKHSFIGADNVSTRVELCRDETGSWLREHGDDPAKIFTLQICLNSLADGTQLGSDSSKTHENGGWYFYNTGSEMHQLHPLSGRRTSIIVNYVYDDMWNDRTVLVED